MELERLITPVTKLACQAGEAIMKIYVTDFHVEKKEDMSPVTAADMAAHHIIEQGLQALTPTIPVLSEESEKISYEQRSQWHCYWLIDPLDGTREFVKKNDEFTVNIALIENGQSVLGVITTPATGECYFAHRGGGAYKKASLDAQPVPLSAREESRDKVVVAGSRSHLSVRFADFLFKLGDYEVIRKGSSLKSCMVAEGSADIYARLGPTSEWDTAAAQCIVEESGGCMTDLEGAPLRYNTKESLINPEFIVYGDKNKNWKEFLPDD